MVQMWKLIGGTNATGTNLETYISKLGTIRGNGNIQTTHKYGVAIGYGVSSGLVNSITITE